MAHKFEHVYYLVHGLNDGDVSIVDHSVDISSSNISWTDILLVKFTC